MLLSNYPTFAQGGLKQFFNWVSSPLRPVWGEYFEPGQTPYPPLTSFYDKSKRAEIITQLKYNIDNNIENYNKFYDDKILSYANMSKLGKQEVWKGVYQNAEIAKCAAFVALLGIDKDGNDLSYAQREAYKNKAIDILEHCDPKSFYNAFYWENQQYRAKELIMYLQAFDYLRTLHEYYGYPMSLTQIENIEDELAEFTKSLHGRANNWLGNYGKMNNLTILTAAATGMAAVVLHGRTAMFFLPQKHPKRWANAAHFYISRSLWNHDKQQSKKGEIGPFADGPSYFEYAFESAIPFFISWDLFLGGKDHTGSYDESLLFSGTESVRNYMYDENYDNLYQWYNEIRMPNSFPPTNDDCWQSENFSALGIARTKKALKKGFTYDAFEPDDYEKMELRGATGLNLAPDYLLALIPTDKRLETKESVNLYSGDIIVRTNKQDGLSNQHYLHVNAEKNEALNAHRILGTGHEHGDALNLIVSSGEDILIFDPSYLGYENRGKINKGKHHNIITSDNSVFGELEPNPGASEVKVLKFETSENYDLIELEIQYTKGLTYGTTINRTIEVVKQYYLPFGKKMPQYHITDRIKNNSIFSAVNTFRLNGNGNSDDNPSTFIQHSNKKFEWNHPCFKDENNLDNWKIFAYIDIPGSSEVNIENDNAHGTFSTRLNYNPDETLLSGQTHICQGNSPKHSQIEISKHTSSYESIIIKTTLLPTPCQNNPVEPKKTKLDSRFTSQLFEFPHENDTLLNYHFSNEADSLINDKNPFGLSDSNIQITSDAKSIFFSYSSNPFFKSGTCISNLNFRKLKMQHGKSLIYHDTTYLNANKNIDFFYEIIGKCKYRAFSACDSETTIDVFIPDGILGQDMTVKNPEITSTYNDTSRVLTLQLPTGLSQFEIELTDPCLVSCYFPSTSETIHETFDFNEGITATLGHKLDIVQPTGLLNITNGSHMQICNGIYLRNRDSLVLYSGCGKDTGQLSITTCDGSGTGAVSAAMEGTGGGAKASKISVMSGGVLILDSNSVTQISNNSELHVWGTLVIKAGATLVIGDGRKCSYASIMVYPGAYVHIEDEAHLEFFKIVGDTQDRHVFFVSKLPTAASAIKGVAPSIVNLLLTDTILTGSETPVELCDLYTVTPDHGIASREWGFSNILKPKADIWVPNDTICQGECLLIDFSASLNDPIRSLEVCRIDTLFGLASEVCFGSMRIEGMQLTQGYNESSECYYSEASLKMFPLCNYIDSGNAWYKIFVKVENHCGIEDTQSVYFFVAKKPSALLALADTLACGGYGTVKAYNYSLVNAEKATYHVHVIDTTQYQDGDENRFFYGADWELYNLHYGDSFEFPDFNWQGGFTYAVSLTQYGWCGESNTSWDTINIQPGAVILASPASVYSNPLGPSALQLQGYVGNADYYTWSPTTDLDNPYVLNPIATPTDTITYILSAFKGSCEAHDTLFVRHNTLAYAGPADTICAGESIILGTSFDASLFLGYQFYENHLVLDEINERLGIDINFFSKLSLYLLSNAGKTALNSCVNYSTFLSTLNREQFYQEPWYAAYLEAFSNTYDFDDAFSLFVSGVNNNGTLSSYIGSNTLYDPICFVDFLNQYDYDIYQTGGVSMNATWEKYEDSISTVLTHYTDQIKATDTLSKPSMYKITVIDNNMGKVEYDQVNIWVQQNIQPLFFVQFQIDSTLYFSNQSEPIDYSTQYLWEFGDGNSSTQLNPIYTFPFFDSSYVVCLSATNRCGTFTVCDTIRVDSSGLIAYSYSKQAEDKTQEFGSAQIKREITVQSFPNPIKNEVSIVYDIPQAYEMGEIVLLNYAGQLVQKTNIKNAKGLTKLSLDGQSSGLYIYQVLIDGVYVKTGKLVKE